MKNHENILNKAHQILYTIWAGGYCSGIYIYIFIKFGAPQSNFTYKNEIELFYNF